MKWLLFSVMLSLFSGCFKKNDSVHFENIEINDIAKEAMVPKLVMTEIENEFKKETKTITPVYIFRRAMVQFNEHSEEVLTKPAIRFQLPKGGGRIDLKDIVTGVGSFYMSFPAEQFVENQELLHIYYISDSPVKKIENESFGMGCGKMVDLKKSFRKLKDADFLKLNTSDLRYLYVAAGRYVFVFRQAAQIYMSQVTITDSRYSKELCLGGDL